MILSDTRGIKNWNKLDYYSSIIIFFGVPWFSSTGYHAHYVKVIFIFVIRTSEVIFTYVIT